MHLCVRLHLNQTKMCPADIREYPAPKVGNFSFRFLGKVLDEIQDDCTAAGADTFDTAVNGLFTAALGASLYRLAAGVDTGFVQGFLDPILCLRGQHCNRPAAFGVLLNMQAVGLGGGLEFHVVIIAVITYILNVMFQVVEMGHFM